MMASVLKWQTIDGSDIMPGGRDNQPMTWAMTAWREVSDEAETNQA